MVVTSFPAAVLSFSIADDDCTILEMLKESVYATDDSGVYWYEATERYKAVVIMAYLMEIDYQIYDMTPESPNFKDADGEDEYVKKVMAFAKANPQLGFVACEDGYFRPNEYATLQQIYDMMAISPKYTTDLRAAWSEMFAKAALDGYKKISAITNEQFAQAIAMFAEMLRMNRYYTYDYATANTKVADCKGIRGPFHERIRTRSNSDRVRRHRIS
jgi:hypothetical protein